MRTAAVAMLLLLALGAASAQKFRKSDQRLPCVPGPGVNCEATNPKRVKIINRRNVTVPLGTAVTPRGTPARIGLPTFAAMPAVVPKEAKRNKTKNPEAPLLDTTQKRVGPLSRIPLPQFQPRPVNVTEPKRPKPAKNPEAPLMDTTVKQRNTSRIDLPRFNPVPTPIVPPAINKTKWNETKVIDVTQSTKPLFKQARQG